MKAEERANEVVDAIDWTMPDPGGLKVEFAEEIRQAEAAARAEERVDSWEEALEIWGIMSQEEMGEWLATQFQNAIQDRNG